MQYMLASEINPRPGLFINLPNPREPHSSVRWKHWRSLATQAYDSSRLGVQLTATNFTNNYIQRNESPLKQLISDTQSPDFVGPNEYLRAGCGNLHTGADGYGYRLGEGLDRTKYVQVVSVDSFPPPAGHGALSDIKTEAVSPDALVRRFGFQCFLGSEASAKYSETPLLHYTTLHRTCQVVGCFLPRCQSWTRPGVFRHARVHTLKTKQDHRQILTTTGRIWV